MPAGNSPSPLPWWLFGSVVGVDRERSTCKMVNGSTRASQADSYPIESPPISRRLPIFEEPVSHHSHYGSPKSLPTTSISILSALEKTLCKTYHSQDFRHSSEIKAAQRQNILEEVCVQNGHSLWFCRCRFI